MTQPNRKPRFPANPDAPKFMPELWVREGTKTEKMPEGLAVDSNCYQYAIGGSAPDGKNNIYDEVIPQPGQLKGYAITDHAFTKTHIRRYTEMDGLKVASTNPELLPPNKAGHYVVGFYVKNLRGPKNPNGAQDYHFIRQDADGGWSEKQGWQNAALAQRYTDPGPDGGYRTLPRRYGRDKNYKFIGYAYVPKEGIDAGFEGILIPSILASKAFEQEICVLPKDLFDIYVGNKPVSEHAASLEYVRELGRTIRKKGISEAADAYDACLDEYVRNLKKPLKASETQIDSR